MKRLLTTITLAGLLALSIGASFLTAPAAHADIPLTVGYQGRLKSSSGTAQTGTFTFTIRVYTAASGGSPLFTDVQPGISVNDGFFSLKIATGTALNFDQPYWLTTEVNSDGEMTPRVELASVGTAYNARRVGGLLDTSLLRSDASTTFSAGTFTLGSGTTLAGTPSVLLQNGATFNGAAVNLNASSNFATNINTGTSTGAVNIGNSAANAVSLVSGSAVNITAGGASTWQTTSGNIDLSSAGSLNLQGSTSLSLATTAGDISLQAGGASTTKNIQVGSGVASTTPDLLVLDLKSTAGDPTGANGSIYYNASTNRFRCFENSAWKNCDSSGSASLQMAYNAGSTITTAGSTDVALTLTSGNFTASGAGSVLLTPTGASSFTSGGALTLTGGAASTWKTTSGNLTIDAAATVNVGTSDATAVAVGKSGVTTSNLGPLTVSQLITGNAGLAVTGATSNINASSNFTTNVNTGTSTGSVNIGNSSAGTIALVSGGAINLSADSASTWQTTTGALGITGAGALTLSGGAASSFATTAGNLTLQPAGTGTTANVQIGAGGGGSTSPDLFVVDAKSSAGDPSGVNGASYYNVSTNKFRCFENGAWKDCDTSAAAVSLQGAYNNGAVITTSGSTNIAFTLASGNFTASGAGSVNLTPTGASSFTSGGALTFTGGAASTWKTSSGALTLDSAAALNLGTTDATAVSIGKSGTVATVNGSLVIPNYIDVTTTSNPAYAEGRVFYDAIRKALAYNNDVNDPDPVHIGQENLVRVKNMSGSLIAKGQVVYFTGSNGVLPTIALAKADARVTSENTAVVQTDIANGGTGYVNTFGILDNLDTSAFSTGDTVYLSAGTAGLFTSTRPSQPNFTALVGKIVVSNATTGSILVNTTSMAKFGGYTAGSLAFGGTDGFIKEDNTNLFWDNTSKRLGIGDNTPTASLTVGSGDLFEVFGATGNVTTQGDITLSTGGGSITATGGALTLQGGAASSFSTTAGNVTLQAAGTGTTANVQIGAGGAGSTTPDLLVLDVKSNAGDPAGVNGATYYNASTNEFRCFENSAWKNCDEPTQADTLQTTYDAGATITTASSTDIAFTLASGSFTATGAGAVNLTPTSASSFTSGGALTLTGGAASTWSTSAGNLTLQAGSGTISLGSTANLINTAANLNLQIAGAGTTGSLQIGVGGSGSTTPDILGLDVKSNAGDPTGFNGAIYYNGNSNKFRCYINGSWSDCDTTGGTTTLQSAYNNGATITTASTTDVAFTLTSGNFTASGAGSVNLTPTGASSFTSGGALTFTGGAASTWGTTAGNITLQAAGTGTTASVKIGAGGAGSTTPDLFALDVKSDAGEPTGFNGAMYYSANLNSFRCFVNGGWQDCGATAASATTLQQAYVAGATITTASSIDLAVVLTSGNLTASGAGSVNLTPTGASSFTSGGALTLTGGAASTWGTSAGNLTLQAAGSGTIATTQIGVGGAGSTTPDFLGLDVKSTTGDPAGGAEGYTYYNTFDNKFRCFEGAAWKDCDTAGSLQSAYSGGATITTAGSTNIALTLASGNFTASGAGSVSLTPTGASSFTSGGALTLQGGAASTWKTTSGALTLDSAAALNLGTTDATSVSIAKSSTNTTINGPLIVPKYVDITTTSNPAYAEGRLFYDATLKTLAYNNEVSGIQSNIGRTLWLRVKNATGSTIAAGKAVYINGDDGAGFPTVVLAKADSATTAQVAGIVVKDIADTAYGYAALKGLIPNLDTSSFTSGDVVYLSAATAGVLTTTKPASPNYSMPLGVIETSNASTGSIEANIAAFTTGSFTAGSVNFGGADGLSTQDNTNLFWDNTSKRLGIGDNTPTASLVVGSGDLFQVFGASGNVTTAGDITLATGGGSITATGGALTLQGGAASSFATTAGNVTLQAAGTGTTANVQIGAGGAGSTTPDLFVVDVKSDSGDPTGTNGASYYNANTNKFRCFENSAWKDCDSTANTSLQTAYNTGATITTAASTNIAFTLTSGNFTASGAGSVNLTPTGASSFTSGGALTLTGGAASTWSTTAGALTLQGFAVTTLKSANQSAGSTNSSAVAVTSGDASGATSNSGNVTVDSGTATGTAGTVGIGTANASAVTLGRSGVTTTNSGALTVSELLTANAGATIAGATTSVNASSNNATNINTGTSTGAVTIGNSSAGAVGVTSGAALTLTAGNNSTWSTTAGTLTMQGFGVTTVKSANQAASTAGVSLKSGDASGVSSNSGNLTIDSGSATGTAGTITIGNTSASALTIGRSTVTTTNAGALTVSQLLTGNLGAAISGAATSINDTSNFATNINTGTSTGAVNIGNSLAGAIGLTSSAAVTISGGAASSFATTAGAITLQPAGTGTTANVQIGAGGGGSTTPDLFVVDAKSTAGDPTGTNGAMYYNANTNKFKCFENSAWKNCDNSANVTLQSVYNAGATITTASSTDIAFTLTSGNFTASGAGSVNLTPTGASSFTSGGALTLTGGADSTWSTSAGTLTLQGFAATTLKSANKSTASANSSNVSIATGNATGTTSNSGNLSLDVGTATQTAGTISIGTANTSAISEGRTGITTTNNGALTVTQLLTGSAGFTLSSGVFAHTSTTATGDIHAVTDNALTTGTLVNLTSSTNSAANTAWSGDKINVTNAQSTTAVSAGSIAGLDLQFNQNPTIAGNIETAARFAVAANAGSPSDSTVSSILSVENNDTATGNQIVVTDGIKILAGTASNITNGINLSGTFATNLITSTNYTVTQAGAITAVGVNAGTGLIQGSGGETLSAGVFAHTSTTATGDIHAVTDTSLTTGSLTNFTSSNNSAADTAWSADKLNITNAQSTTAVVTGSIAGLDLQFTQNPTVAGSTETVARFAIAANAGSPTDSTVTSLLSLENNDTATGNQIVATNGLKITATTASNITNALNLSGTFATNLITSSNFVVTAGGVITTGTWNASIIGLAYGGTNNNLTAVNGGVVYSDATKLNISAAGVTGQVLQSAGAAAPTWVDGGTAMLSGNSSNTAVNNTTLYYPVTGGVAGSATDISGGTRNLMSRAGTVKNLYVKLSAALGAGKTGTVTVFKNGVATALKTTLSVGPTAFNDTSDTFTVAAGDEISIEVTTTGNVKFSWATDLTY